MSGGEHSEGAKGEKWPVAPLKKTKKDYEDKGLPGRDAVYPVTKISKNPAVCILSQEQSAVQYLALVDTLYTQLHISRHFLRR
jgi:hypothetical protein